MIAAALVATLVIVLAKIAPESDSDADQTAVSAVAPESDSDANHTAVSAVAPESPPIAIAPFDAAQAKAHQDVWASHLGVPVEITNSIGMKFILIPPGRFTMGSQPEEEMETAGRNSGSAKPAHQVTISNSLFFGMHEVTKSQWTEVTDVNPASEITSRLPANGMSWLDATAFCSALSDRPAEKAAGRIYRLPTEAEWEYVCRAGTTGPYFWGNDPARSEEFAWTTANSGTQTHPVGKKLSNPWGVFDMYGNIWEWCQDWYGAYPIQSPSGPRTGTLRVQRGGCFNSEILRSTYRNMNPPHLHHNLNGLRLVLDVPLKRTGSNRTQPPSTSE